MTEEQGNELPTAPYFRMIILGLVLVSPSFLYGLNLTYPTVALPQMDMDVDASSWFGSVAVYISPLSSILAGLIIDSFGRRTALLLSIVPSIAGWSLLYFSSEEYLQLAGQMLNGLTVGAVFYPVQVYAGECIMIDSIRLRNSFLTWIGVSSSLGTTAMLGMANVLNYRQICAASLILCILLLLTFSFIIPESPSWLYRRGRICDARSAEKKLGIRQPILHDYPPNPKHFGQLKKRHSWSAFASKMKKVKRKDVYRPLFILSLAGILLPCAGMMTSSTYMIYIIEGRIPGVNYSDYTTPQTNISSDIGALALSSNQTSESTEYVPSDSNKYSIICGVFMCAGSLLSSIALPCFGIKKMIIFSNLGAVLGLTSLTYAYYLEPSPEVTVIRIAAVTLLAFLLGTILGPICACSGDIYPADAKGFASLSDICANFSAASANKLYPYLCITLGGYAYCVYAVMGVLGAIYVHFFAPEVVGKTLEEINKEFLMKKSERL